METDSNENPSDCQAVAADSTTTPADENSGVVNAAAIMALSIISEEAQPQVSSTTASSQTTTTIALPVPTNDSPTPPQSSNSNNNNGSNNNKLKSQQIQQQQQQQQQQQYHQFRAPQQFVRHKKSTSSLTKKNKTWNKRQNKTTKQQQNFTISAAPGAGSASVIGGGCQVVGGSIINSVGASVGVGSSPGGGTLPTTKADLENIQNFKNQLGVGGGSHHYYHNHHGHHGNGLPSSSLAGGVEKLGYGHGHLKQQLYKKMLMHRGHHHHVLCAGAAHNTLGGGANVACCLNNGCSGQNVKDNSSGVVGCGVSAVTNPNATGVSNTLHYCCGRSKFFLPGNRLRKEAIIPPTKFLLGGNISDPLNLNSLQNETSNASSNNNTPATTPRQSPITTPPKVEVIIPPNIHDPLHLLDPVDSMEYEKQLTSPMKRGGGPRGSNKQHHKHHRHRKNRKPKRRRYESFTSTSTTGALEIADDTSSLGNSTISTDASSSALSISLLDSGSVGGGNSSMSISAIAPAAAVVEFRAQEHDENVLSPSVLSTEECTERNALLLSPQSDAIPQQQVLNSTMVAAVGERDTLVVADAILPRERERQRAIRDLRLELNSTSSSTCGSAIGNLSGNILYGNAGAGGAGGGRKRKISESNNSQKNKKFHRLDSMDKIVSPVVPQPGAWKRPPRVVPSGARKTSTRRSTSVSESELLSPVDDVTKTLQPEAETPRVETPDLNKVETISEVGLGSPLISNSVAISVAAGEHMTVTDASTGDSSTKLVAIATDESNSKAEEELPLSTTTTTTATPVKQLEKMPKFRADGAKYRFGNYDRYAGFRHLNEFMDVRLHVFQRHLELFQNKDILDIGCNVGHMAITVARNLAPKSILGIDIDKELISRARRNLALYVRIPHDPVKKEEIIVVSGSGGVKTHDATTIGGSVAEIPIIKASSSNNSNKKFKKKIQRKEKQCPQDTIMHHTHYQHRLLHHYHSHHHYQMQHQHLQKQQQLKLHVPAKELFPVSFPLSYGGIPTTQAHHFGGEPTSPVYTSTSTPGPSNSSATPSNHTSYSSSTKSKNDFPRNVFFRQTNYVLKDESQLCNDTQQYDLIMCLSVTKWIHLNFGDAGLKLAFKRMFNQLRPGGKLILEAQNWASYKKKKNLTEEIYTNYRNIEFFPNKFHEYLLSSDVGFSHSYTLGVPRHLSKGFCRPIQLYAKGDYTPNHVRWSDAYYPQTPYEAYRGIYATMPPRPAGMASYPMSSTRSQTYDTPHYTGGTSGPYSCRQTPMHQLTSQYYNPLETDSYLPSYDMEYLNHMYVFASPLYQTVWSPPASLRNSSSHTPVFGSVRDAELDGDGIHRHVYPPNDDTSSPNANAGGAFNSIRDADTDDSNQMPASNVQHVYATNCGESSSSPQVHHHDSETIDGLMLDEEPIGAGTAAVVSGGGGGSSVAGTCCDLNNE